MLNFYEASENIVLHNCEEKWQQLFAFSPYYLDTTQYHAIPFGIYKSSLKQPQLTQCCTHKHPKRKKFLIL